MLCVVWTKGSAGSQPPAGVLQPDPIVFVEVVAYPDIGAAVVVQIPQGNGERLGNVGQTLRAPASTFLQVDVDPRRIGKQVISARFDHLPGVVGAGDEIEVAVLVQVAPVHGVGRPGDTPQRQELEAAAAEIAEDGRRRNATRKHDIQHAVSVHIHDGSGARAMHHGQGLPLEAQPALVPQDGGRAGEIGEYDIGIAVVVEVVDGQAAAVAVKETRRGLAGIRDMIQVMDDKGPCKGQPPPVVSSVSARCPAGGSRFVRRPLRRGGISGQGKQASHRMIKRLAGNALQGVIRHSCSPQGDRVTHKDMATAFVLESTGLCLIRSGRSTPHWYARIYCAIRLYDPRAFCAACP